MWTPFRLTEMVLVMPPAVAVMVPLLPLPEAVKTPSWVMVPMSPVTLQVTPPVPERRAVRDQ